MIRFFIAIVLTCLLAPCAGQNFSRAAADSLLEVLRSPGNDKNTLYTSLRLSDFYILNAKNKNESDSADLFISKASRINNDLQIKEAEGYIYLQQARLYKKKQKITLAKQLLEKAISVFKSTGSEMLTGNAWLTFSDFYNIDPTDSLILKIKYAELCLDAYNKSGNLEKQVFCMQILTDLYNLKEEYQKARDIGMATLNKYKNLPGAEMTEIYIQLATICRNQIDLIPAVNYCLKALQSAAARHDSGMQMCQLNYMAGLIYHDLHDYNAATKYMKDALQLAEQFNDTSAAYLTGSSLAAYYVALNRDADGLQLLDNLVKKYGWPRDTEKKASYLLSYLRCYTMSRQLSKGQIVMDSMLALADLPAVEANHRFSMYIQAMRFILVAEKFEKSRILIPKFRNAMSQIRSPIGQQLGYEVLFKLDSAQGFYQSAIKNLLQRDNIKDTILTESKNKQIAQLRTEYDTYQKEKDIELLQKEGLLQRGEIKQSKLAMNYFIGGLLLLLGLLTLAISRYRLKQRNNLQLEIRQKEITSKNNQLEKLLHENEWLLKEVHHRVKNNLQVVMSLLNSQSSYLKDEEAVNAVLQSRNRVQAMSLIHQKLYKTENVSTINMHEYIRELIDYLKDCARPGLNILYQLDIADVELDVMEAVPVGLILNEVITNSCKYAFPEGYKSTITIKLACHSENELTLYIADNGIGLPAEYDKNQGNSFGMLLIRGMAEDLDGTLKIDNTSGAAYTIKFPYRTSATRTLKIA